MLRKCISVTILSIASYILHSQNNQTAIIAINTDLRKETYENKISKQFSTTSDFLDAAINSINSFNSLIKKENYRIKITSFNNPTSSDMGFSLENEIQAALKPLLAKAKSTNTTKFSQVVSSLVTNQSKTVTPVTSATKVVTTGINPIFSTLLSLVGTLTIQEKKITRDDLDSFISATSKYFVQYEKLNQANIIFDQNVENLNNKLKDLQFDIKEYMLDMITILNRNIQRNSLKNLNTEELFLKYLDKTRLEGIFSSYNEEDTTTVYHYPTDGIKTAKDIAYNLQKLFNEYQKVYGDNYQQIRSILSESKMLGKNINTRQVDASMKDLEQLYNDSKDSDVLSLRLKTLFQRLELLTATEQTVNNKK
ncbi:MAG TPA: hypothetical protein VGQ09_09320 [Chitinophagaceae bacterium]|jgi:hypothetical protein|nr:hypothetical protein [Chitinophagaceae bacterium]